MKQCITCKTEYTLENFHKCTANKDGKSPYCKQCHRKRCIEWQHNNKEKVKAVRRNTALKRLYGITHSDYLEMLEKQEHLCAGCNVHIDEHNNNFSVDHCHKTNKVRGLLCNNCNRGLGLLQDSQEVLTNLIKYLEEHSGITHE